MSSYLPPLIRCHLISKNALSEINNCECLWTKMELYVFRIRLNFCCCCCLSRVCLCYYMPRMTVDSFYYGCCYDNSLQQQFQSLKLLQKRNVWWLISPLSACHLNRDMRQGKMKFNPMKCGSEAHIRTKNVGRSCSKLKKEQKTSE